MPSTIASRVLEFKFDYLNFNNIVLINNHDFFDTADTFLIKKQVDAGIQNLIKNSNE
jgi:hypothetical protein